MAQLFAKDEFKPISDDWRDTTSSEVGTKSALDVAIQYDVNHVAIAAILAQSSAQSILDTLLNGTLPRDVYNKIELTVSGTDYTYTFSYNGVRQFIIVISDPTGNYTTALTELNNLLLDDGGLLQLEDDGELFTEG